MLVAIDCRPTLAKNNCWGQEGLTCARYSTPDSLFMCLFFAGLDHPYFRAAAASLLTLKAQGATLEVITSVKRPPGIIEVQTHLLFEKNYHQECQKQVGLGIGDGTRIGEAESAFTSVQEPKVD